LARSPDVVFRQNPAILSINIKLKLQIIQLIVKNDAKNVWLIYIWSS